MLSLPSHNRYDFSSIQKRKDYSWPGGKRLAFYVALNVEHFAFGTGRVLDPTNRGGPPTQRNFAWLDYGNRVGIWRLFGMLDQLKLPASILLNGQVAELYPDIVEKIRSRGDDVLGHGRTNSELLSGRWEHDEARIIAETTEAIAKHVGVRPTGWMGPGAAESNVTPDLLKEAGYTHILDWPMDDQPLWMRTRSGRSSRSPIRWSSTTRARWPSATTPAGNSPTWSSTSSMRWSSSPSISRWCSACRSTATSWGSPSGFARSTRP